jgi:predicted nucleic acid-binding protein
MQRRGELISMNSLISVFSDQRGILDTSVLIDLDQPEVFAQLPRESAVAAISLAELAAGPVLASDRVISARRQFRLQQVESTFEVIEFGSGAARAYGQVVSAVHAHGRSHRSRVADLLVAATAINERVALYTRNPSDFEGLDDLLQVIGI